MLNTKTERGLSFKDQKKKKIPLVIFYLLMKWYMAGQAGNFDTKDTRQWRRDFCIQWYQNPLSISIHFFTLFSNLVPILFVFWRKISWMNFLSIWYIPTPPIFNNLSCLLKQRRKKNTLGQNIYSMETFPFRWITENSAKDWWWFLISI